MMVVVVPLIIAVLLATLLAPLADWLRRHRVRPGLAAFLPVVLAFVVFVGLWGLVIPPFVSQVPDLVDNVQQGAGQVADFAKPLGISAQDVDNAVQKARDQLQGRQAAGQVLSGRAADHAVDGRGRADRGADVLLPQGRPRRCGTGWCACSRASGDRC